MRTVTLLVLVLAFTFAAATKPKSLFTRYRSWNSRMYPVWKDGDARFRNCWFGGEVTFELRNDAPTLTGAKATFNIDLHFPPNQTVLADGQVVWARNCTINGKQYEEGQAVYANQDTDGTGVFPDGTPFTRGQNKKPHYVFVWKTWGRYWQVADGPSSSLTIGTDNVPLGSYNMEVVIYHCRGKNKFIPLGYASTVFSITDQIPFTVSLNQINDVNQDDQSFIQNRAIAFSVKLHDPSQYLGGSDLTFNWDFGDNTGTLISRERTVTHTYLSQGTYKPQVVLMASIPNDCGNPTAVVPIDASAVPAVVVMASTPGSAPTANSSAPTQEGDTIALDVPASEATPADDLSLAASVQPAEAASIATNTDDGETVVDTAAEGVEVASVAPAGIDAAVVPVEEDPAIVAPTENTAAPPVEVDDTAEDTDAAAAAVATAAPVAPATEEPGNADVTAADEATVVADAAEVPVIDTVASATPVAEGEETAVDLAATVLTEVPDAVTDAPAAEVAVEEETEAIADDAAATEVVQAETVAPADNVIAPAATESTAVVEAVPAEPTGDTETEIVETANEALTTAEPAVNEETAPAEGEVETAVEIEADADPAQVALVVAKRQAPELTADCMVYRYGSLSTSVDIIEGIVSVEIVQVANVVSMATELEQNAVDLTITCQGSLPNEVCTVISDADCTTPLETVCNAATPSPDCQMILRQFFNDSGVFCINVSLTNDVSLAVASARVSVTVDSNASPATTAATVLGVLVLACVVGSVALMYRRFKQYQPLREDHVTNGGGSSAVTSVPLLLWNLLSRQSPGESRPLLQGRVV